MGSSAMPEPAGTSRSTGIRMYWVDRALGVNEKDRAERASAVNEKEFEIEKARETERERENESERERGR